MLLPITSVGDNLEFTGHLQSSFKRKMEENLPEEWRACVYRWREEWHWGDNTAVAFDTLSIFNCS